MYCGVDVVVPMGFTIDQHHDGIADFANKEGIVRGDDQGAIRAPVKQMFLAARMKPLIAHQQNLINQVTIKLDSDRQCNASLARMPAE